jgi:hypothetical protein
MEPLRSLISKSKFAFNCSIEDLVPSHSGKLYMWTFTFAQVLDVKEARERWSTFLDLFRRRKRYRGFHGLRVFELHPGGHGLHVHVITGNYLHVNDVRALWRSCGGGRIHVLPIAPNRAGYVGKYLTKRGRPVCFKAVRLWAKFGVFVATKVKDIKIESDWTRTYSTLKATLGRTFLSLSWFERRQAVANVERCRVWWFGVFPMVSGWFNAIEETARPSDGVLRFVVA